MKKNTLSILSLLIVTCFCIPIQAQVKALNKKQLQVLIDSISSAFKTNYVSIDKGLEISKTLKNNLQKGNYNSVSDAQKLAFVLEQDILNISNDRHIHIRYLPELLNPANVKDTTIRQKIEDDNLQFAKDNNFMFKKVEILPGNIGYLAFNQFLGPVESAKPTLNALFNFLKYTKTIIIDLRNNGGGNSEMANHFQNYFFDKETLLTNFYQRAVKDSIPVVTNPDKSDGIHITVPIYILTSGFTASGAEIFAYNLQSLKRAKIVGGRTSGSVHLTRFYDLGNGFIADIPFGKSINPYTKKDIEGTGITPDFAVEPNYALEKAQQIILTNQLEKAENLQEKRILDWAINALKVTNNEQVSKETLLKYCGDFAGLTFYIKDGDLLCKNKDLGNLIFKLKACTSNRFLVDENLQVEFIKDRNEAYSSLRMLFKDGNEFVKGKIE